jgi:hypothetical protein
LVLSGTVLRDLWLQHSELDERVLDSTTWVGAVLPFIDRIDISDRLHEGRWIVVLYRRSCPDCQELLSHVKDLLAPTPARLGDRRIALVEVPPLDRGHMDVPTNEVCVYGHLSPKHPWLLHTPTVVWLKEGTVERTAKGRTALAELELLR